MFDFKLGNIFNNYTDGARLNSIDWVQSTDDYSVKFSFETYVTSGHSLSEFNITVFENEKFIDVIPCGTTWNYIPKIQENIILLDFVLSSVYIDLRNWEYISHIFPKSRIKLTWNNDTQQFDYLKVYIQKTINYNYPTTVIQDNITQTYTSDRLEDGTYLTRIVSWTNCGGYGYSDLGFGYVENPPLPNEFQDYTYYRDIINYQYGYVLMNYKSPDIDDLDKYYLYKNQINELGIPSGIPSSVPISYADLTPNNFFSIFSDDILVGKNVWINRNVDMYGLQEENYSPFVLYIDENGYEVIYPNKPLFIYVSCGVLSVAVDTTATSIKLYHDNQTGTINYSSVYATINCTTSDAINVYTYNLTGLTSGTYKFAARASNQTTEESNTDVYCLVYYRSSNQPSTVKNISVEVV